MKLYEIPNYLNKKVRRIIWPDDCFIYFKNGYWLDECGQFYRLESMAYSIDWEEFKGTPQRKRFWRWIIDINGIKKTSHYIDDNGLDSAKGMSFPSFDWGLIKKKKLESDFIDCILVDGKWELEI